MRGRKRLLTIVQWMDITVVREDKKSKPLLKCHWGNLLIGQMSERHVIALQFISSQISFHASTAITNKTELPIYSFKITSDDQRRLFVDIGLLKKMKHKSCCHLFFWPWTLITESAEHQFFFDIKCSTLWNLR